jgi:hypothetical protein
MMNAIGQDLVREAAALVLSEPDFATDPLTYLRDHGVACPGRSDSCPRLSAAAASTF